MICTTAKLRVDEINAPERLEDFRLIWQALLTETPNASFFHTLDWLQTYWRYFGAKQRLRVLVVARGTHPIGILPLTIRREKTRLGTVRVLTYPLDDWGSFYGPIGPNPAATLAAGMRHIARTTRRWELLDLRWTDRDDRDRRRTPTAMEVAGLTPHERVWNTTALVDVNADWRTYWSSRSSKFRHNIHRLDRHFQERGNVRHIRYRPPGRLHGDANPRWDLYDACTRLTRASWQRSDPDRMTFAHEEVAEFFRDMHCMAARNGMVDMNLLMLNNRPVAYQYNYCHAGHLIGLRMGYDPAYRHYGVGNILMYRMLKDSAERHDIDLDLGVGSMHYKRRWATRFKLIHQYTHYPRWAPRGQLLRLKHWTDARRKNTPAKALIDTNAPHKPSRIAAREEPAAESLQ